MLHNEIERPDAQALLASVQKAMEDREICVYYQPKFDAVTSKLTGAEALVRWIRPDGSMVMPGAFIPQLEADGNILELDWYVLREVCAFLANQQRENIRNVPVSVNFSRLHVFEKDYLERLSKTVDDYGIAHRLIEVEITESALVDRSDLIAGLIDGIRRAGFRVAIDDFGSGLSSLSFVKDMSVDVLKIDKSLLSGNCEDEKERIVLESIVNFAHRLKLTTVAEGVETKEQLGFLRTCGCKVIQGFLFSRPVPQADYTALCRKDSEMADGEDILITQPASSANELLLEAVHTEYQLIVMINLSRNSYYMMEYKNFTQRSFSASGVYDEIVAGTRKTLREEDRDVFCEKFGIAGLLAAYRRGERTIHHALHQKGDDGIYRKLEIASHFVKNPSSSDVLCISMCRNVK